MHPARIDYPEHLAKFRTYTLIRFPLRNGVRRDPIHLYWSARAPPGFNLILSHGGGNLPYLRGRLDTAYDATGWEADPSTHEHISHRPSHYFQQLFYDTCVLSADSLRFLIPLVGATESCSGATIRSKSATPKAATRCLRSTN